uniref:Uncharacterized protein p53-2 n=1 Tax=Hyposoter didymator TaxID=260305 RepID=D7P5M3_HYPDD|nr:unknown [Hyposoter didymator]
MVQPGNTAAAMSKPEHAVKSGAANEPAQVGAGGNAEDVDVATDEQLNKELESHTYPMNCVKGMRLKKIAKYPKHHDKGSPFESHIVVTEKHNKVIRVGAIIVNGRAVKGSDKISHWKGLRLNPNYMDALLTSLGESIPNSVHAFQAKLRYPDDFVLAIIAPPNITMFPDEPLPEGFVPDTSLQYEIVVQQNKHDPDRLTSAKKSSIKRWFKDFTWKSVSEKVARAEQKCSHEDKTVGYVAMPESGHTHVPIRASAPRLDDEPYGFHHRLRKRMSTDSSHSNDVTGTKKPSEGIQAAMQTYGIPAVLAIGSAGAAIGGAVWLSKSPRMKSYIGL